MYDLFFLLYERLKAIYDLFIYLFIYLYLNFLDLNQIKKKKYV